MKLTRFRSFAPSSTYEKTLDKFFNDRYRMLLGMNEDFTPAVNTAERKDSYEIEVAVPGIKKDNIDISVNDGILTISSQSATENNMEDNGYTSREFNYSTFTRSFTLPKDVDDEHINAKYEDGVLKVRLPRELQAEENEATRHIPIQ